MERALFLAMEIDETSLQDSMLRIQDPWDSPPFLTVKRTVFVSREPSPPIFLCLTLMATLRIGQVELDSSIGVWISGLLWPVVCSLSILLCMGQSLGLPERVLCKNYSSSRPFDCGGRFNDGSSLATRMP